MSKRCLTREEVRAIGIEDDAENQAILLALAIAQFHGYGNLLAFLATEWALRLREDGLDEETAIKHVTGHCTPYPLPK